MQGQQADIFTFSSVRLKKLPILNEFLPLTLFAHADENLVKSIKRLKKFARSTGPGFLRTLEKVHEHQRVLLATIFVLFHELDDEYKTPKTYRSVLPPADRAELESTYSENILFAAEALSGGFRIRGIEGQTSELIEPAKTLIGTLQALRASLRLRCDKSIYPPYYDIFEVLGEFDKAWADFESRLCDHYRNSYGDMNLVMERLQFLQGVMSETLSHAIRNELITVEALESRDPSLIIGLPRLSLVMGIVNLDTDEGTQEDEKKQINLLTLFPDEAFILTQIRDHLAGFSEEMCDKLQRMLLDNENYDSSDVDPENPEVVQEIFIQICRIADELQTGQHARYFVDILGQVFTAYA